ncbi:MAG: FAD:protein FMN transferase [Candidatus Omnitrophica bacterium]|nr:FAD:protein FMN transferase [Candidatus Omnitrophota bacterium]
MIKGKIFPAILLCTALLSGCSRGTSVTENIVLMDTFGQIEVKNVASRAKGISAIKKTLSRMERLSKRFDYFSRSSELSRINKLKPGEIFSVSEEMFEVLRASRNFYNQTGGVFDVAFPSENKINQAEKPAGRDSWILDKRTKTVSLKYEGVKLNLGGIAKGFIVDEGIKILKKLRITNALVNAGGDMYCMGGARGKGWKIGIRNPADPEKIIATFEMRDKGVATSGGYERFEEFNGKRRISHIIDPRTGRPVEKILESVTVVANDCMTADALATALYILDPRSGVSLIEGVDGAECVIIDEEGQFHISSGLRGKLNFPPS